jgi:hypothetical protein
MIYDPINYKGVCRTRYNNVLYMVYDKLDTVRMVKIEECCGWETSLECKNWILAENLIS